MTVHYMDPSAWIQRHFVEVGSATIRDLFDRQIHAACSRAGPIEMTATVARKAPHDAMDAATVAALLASMDRDFAAFTTVDVDDEIITAARDVAKRHRLRAMDAVHLASALRLRAVDDVIMVSADLELLTAAAQEGLAVLNPAPPT
jgi:predicted nucleic acid-binding protein